MPISNVSGSNFTTLYSSQGNANPYVPIPPSNANVSGQNYTTLYSLGSGVAPVPIEAYGNANVESFLAVGSDTGGNTVGNIVSSGQISATGNITTDQYFIGTFLGNIVGNLVVPGFNTQVLYNNNGNAGASSGLTFVDTSNTLTSGNVVSAVGNITGGNIRTAGQVTATGNVTGNVFTGNGAGLTNINAANIIGGYGNANVAANLAAFATNPISTSGNITAGYFTGNGSLLTSITGANVTGVVANATYALNANAATYATNAVQANVANVANSVAGANVTGTVANATYALNSNAATFAGTVTTAAQPNITSVGILTVINTSGAISATGNITGNVFSGNGSGLTNINAANIIGAYGNANVAANLAAFANNPISTSGNITAGYFIGNGSALTSLTGANVTGTVANATYALNANAATYSTYAVDAVQANYANIANSVAGANVTGTVGLAQYVTQNAQANITSVGTLTSLSVSGNIISGNITNLGTIASTGNITAPYFLGNVSGNITGNIDAAGSNTQVQFNDTGDILGASANFTFDKVSQVLAVNGNVTANYFIGNGSALTSLTGANVTGTVPLAQYVTQNAQANITSVGTLTSLSVSGNVDAGNLRTAGLVTATGNITGGNLITGGQVTATGNVTTGNITNNGTIISTGNITAPNFIGNVIGNIDAGGANTQVQFNDSDVLNGTAGFTFDKTSNAVAITGNITSANVATGGLVTATGNITGGNLITGGLITAVGDITSTGNINGNNINATANIGSTQQTIIGTANTTASSTGNIVMSGRNIATDVVFAPDASNTTTPTGGRVLIGAGIAGNTSIAAWDNNNQLRGTRVAIMDAYTKNNSSVVSAALKSWSAVTLNANITAGGPRIQGIGAALNVGGGSAGNTYLPTHAGGPAAVGIAPVVSILNLGGANGNLVTQIGANVSAAYSTAYGAITQSYGSGTYVGNMQGVHTGFFTNNTVSNIRNVIGYSINAGDNAGNTTGIGNTIGFLFPGQSATGTEGQYGAAVSGSFTKGNLFAFMNAGNLAQVRLGSTREQHYYAYPHTTTTGNVIVDATNGKIQTLTPTGNVTITDFTNFVDNAFNNALGTTIPQADDVTLIITQPLTAPFYTVTLPTTVASTGYPVQYQNGLQTVASTSYARTIVTIRPSPVGVNGNPWYVSVAASSGVLAAAGSNLEVQFNDANNMGAVQNFTYDKANNSQTVGNIVVYDITTSQFGNIFVSNVFAQTGGTFYGPNVQATIDIKTPNLYANTIYDNGAGNISVITGNINVTGNINGSNNLYANIITAGAYVSTPALFTSDLTPPGGGPLQTTTTLSTITGNLSVTGTIIGTGNITGGNLRTSGSVSATGNVTSGNVLTGIVSATGNVIGSNVFTGGSVSASGKVIAGTDMSAIGNVVAGNIYTTGTSTLGSIQSYSQSQYTLGTSGTINIDKTAGQVQYLAPTGNVTIGSLTNFVTTQGSQNQADTVTLVIKQGATPYTVTMPTGNAAIKYAGNITSVGTTANSVTMISMTGANIASAAMYMLTISPEFS